jgi:hypothetical protein
LAVPASPFAFTRAERVAFGAIRDERPDTVAALEGAPRAGHSDVGRNVRFYRDVLGLEVKTRYPNAAFLKIPGTPTIITSGCSNKRASRGPTRG